MLTFLGLLVLYAEKIVSGDVVKNFARHSEQKGHDGRLFRHNINITFAMHKLKKVLINHLQVYSTRHTLYLRFGRHQMCKLFIQGTYLWKELSLDVIIIIIIFIYSQNSPPSRRGIKLYEGNILQWDSTNRRVIKPGMISRNCL